MMCLTNQSMSLNSIEIEKICSVEEIVDSEIGYFDGYCIMLKNGSLTEEHAQRLVICANSSRHYWEAWRISGDIIQSKNPITKKIFELNPSYWQNQEAEALENQGLIGLNGNGHH